MAGKLLDEKKNITNVGSGWSPRTLILVGSKDKTLPEDEGVWPGGLDNTVPI